MENPNMLAYRSCRLSLAPSVNTSAADDGLARPVLLLVLLSVLALVSDLEISRRDVSVSFVSLSYIYAEMAEDYNETYEAKFWEAD